LTTFPLPDHIALTALLMLVGAVFWVFDEHFGRQAKIDRDWDYGAFGLEDPGLTADGSRKHQENQEKLARVTGFAFIGAGLVSGIALGMRLIF
jgi:hypothetical protein